MIRKLRTIMVFSMHLVVMHIQNQLYSQAEAIFKKSTWTFSVDNDIKSCKNCRMVIEQGGERLAVSFGNQITILDAESGKKLKQKTFRNDISWVQFLKYGVLRISDHKGNFMDWNFRTNEQSSVETAKYENIFSFVNVRGDLIVNDKGVLFFNKIGSSAKSLIRKHVFAIEYGAENDLIILGNNSAILRILKLNPKQMSKKIDLTSFDSGVPRMVVSICQLSDYYCVLCTDRLASYLLFVDSNSHKLVKKFIGSSALHTLNRSPCGKYLIGCGNTLTIWDIDKKKPSRFTLWKDSNARLIKSVCVFHGRVKMERQSFIVICNDKGEIVRCEWSDFTRVLNGVPK